MTLRAPPLSSGAATHVGTIVGLLIGLAVIGAILVIDQVGPRREPRAPAAHPAWLSAPLRTERAFAKLEQPEDRP